MLSYVASIEVFMGREKRARSRTLTPVEAIVDVEGGFPLRSRGWN